MSSLAAHGHAAAPARPRWWRGQSILTGLVAGLAAAIIAGVLVHHLVGGARRGDDTLVAGYLAWLVFFLVGMGAANYPLRWGFGRGETTHEEELALAGRDEGVWRYFRFCTDHKVVGVQYLVVVLVLFAVGGLASWMIRLEQMQSGAKVFTPATYNTIVGMHGIVMIAATIIMTSGSFGNYFVPIMIGAKDMAFPRLNALSFWTLFAAVPVLLSAIVLGGFPTGWTGYSPLADQAALGMDAYCFTIIVFAFSIALGAINIFVTVVKMRAPGMSVARIPYFVWGVLLSTMLGLVVFPTFMAAVVLTLMDRVFGTSFYLASQGGNNLLYEQLFWFMGHPEVYVIALPSMGIMAEVVTVFTRKPLFAGRLVLGGMFGVVALSVVVWMHHIYWSGGNTALDGPMMLDTELISIPTGLVFLGLIGTFWRGRIRFEVPMLFALGFVVNFIIGGVTGLYLADVPTDALFHGDMFTVAHFHFTLVGGMVFGFLTAFYYWFPKVTGRHLDQTLAKIQFWTLEIGFLGVFLPLFFAGLDGEPRWQAFISPSVATPNLIASLFAVVIVISAVVFVYNVVWSWVKGPVAEADPWGGRTLEWMLPSPVPLENFDRPVVVTAGGYDYGAGGARRMGALVMAGGSAEAAALPAPGHADLHEASRPDRARYGALLMIASDLMFVLALYVGFIYLRGLNTQGQFRAHEPSPSTVGDVLITLAALAGAAAWTWGYRRSRAGQGAQVLPWLALGGLLTLAGLVGNIVLFGSLRAPLPMHAFASAVDMFILYHAWHLIVCLAVMSLVAASVVRGRSRGREYTIQIVGWWLWWTAIAAVALLVLMLAFA